jgi:ketosteroid isomerase-like protein
MIKQCFIIILTFSVQVFSQSGDEKAIRAASAKFSSDYVAGDFRAMADAYTANAVLMAPAREIITGRENIFMFWNGLPKTSALLKHKVVPERIFINGNEAHDHGYFYTQSQKPGEEPGPVLSAKYYILWEKDGIGVWRMKMDMWNSRDPEQSKNPK